MTSESLERFSERFSVSVSRFENTKPSVTSSNPGMTRGKVQNVTQRISTMLQPPTQVHLHHGSRRIIDLIMIVPCVPAIVHVQRWTLKNSTELSTRTTYLSTEHSLSVPELLSHLSAGSANFANFCLYLHSSVSAVYSTGAFHIVCCITMADLEAQNFANNKDPHNIATLARGGIGHGPFDLTVDDLTYKDSKLVRIFVVFVSSFSCSHLA